MNWRPKALGVVAVTAALLCVSATGASADAPETVEFTDSFSVPNTSLCGFEVRIESQVS
jgi:hypothetical protein